MQVGGREEIGLVKMYSWVSSMQQCLCCVYGRDDQGLGDNYEWKTLKHVALRDSRGDWIEGSDLNELSAAREM